MVGSIFIDTNVLSYAEANDPKWGAIAQKKIAVYEQKGFDIWISRQIIREFLMVTSRKMKEVDAYDAKSLADRIQAFQKQYFIADETEFTTHELLKLIDKYQIVGKSVHDCNVIATIKVHQIKNLLTHNVADFKKYRNEGFKLIPLLP